MPKLGLLQEDPITIDVQRKLLATCHQGMLQRIRPSESNLQLKENRRPNPQGSREGALPK